MLYCEKCKSLSNNSECSFCGAKKLRPLNENDPVYLITKNFIFSGMVEEILKQNNIPYLKQGQLGAAIAVMAGRKFEEYKFYVPFAAYEKANELLKELFGGIEEEQK